MDSEDLVIEPIEISFFLYDDLILMLNHKRGRAIRNRKSCF